MTQSQSSVPLWLLVSMWLILAALLGTSIWQRFQHPDLVAMRMPEAGHTESAGNMGQIGQLMEQVAKNPTDLEATIRLTENLMAIGQWESAENFAQKALSMTPADSQEIRPLYLLGLIHHNRGENEQAAELLEKTLEKDDNPSARYSLGILYLHYLKQRERGLEHLRKALASNRATPSLKAAITEELEKITPLLPKEDANALAHPLEDAN